jgi:putative oxidoreductase
MDSDIALLSCETHEALTAHTPEVHERMANDDVLIIRPAIGIAARFLFTLIFFLSGITHFTAMQNYVALMPAAIPWRAFWVLSSAVVELAGAAMIMFNYRPRLGGWLIVLFLVPVTAVVHGTAMLTLADPVMRAVNVSFFLKGLAMIACALFITQFGVRVEPAAQALGEATVSPATRARTAV